MTSKCLKVIEAIMQGICNQPQEKRSVSIEKKTGISFMEPLIDYEKLASTIVDAQKKANEPNQNEVGRKRIGIFRSICYILAGKSSDDGRYLVGPFTLLVSIIFKLLATAGLIALVGLDVSIISKWNKPLTSKETILLSLMLVFLNLVSVLIIVLFIGAANDVEKEKDKSLVLGAFSGLISVAALIVAIIALCRGL